MDSDSIMASKITDMCSEYATLLPVNSEYDKIASIFEQSYGSTEVCISAIFKIHNQHTSDFFEAQRLEIKQKRKVDPQIIDVFHGTKMSVVKNIMATGFDPSYNRVMAFGRGTYASPKVKTALGYCKDATIQENTSMIFLCRFLLGTYGACGVGGIDTSRIDYSGNNSNIYVTPYRYGIIPDYLICYHKS